MSYRGNIEIESKDGHYGMHDFEDDIDSKEKTWIDIRMCIMSSSSFHLWEARFPSAVSGY